MEGLWEEAIEEEAKTEVSKEATLEEVSKEAEKEAEKMAAERQGVSWGAENVVEVTLVEGAWEVVAKAVR